MPAGTWIYERTSPTGGGSGGGNGDGGGGNPPIPASDPKAAPNIVDATVNVVRKDGDYGFSGMMLLPVNDPKYGNLKKIEVVGTHDGQSKTLTSITQWGGPPNSLVAYEAMVGPDVTNPEDWVLSYVVYNANGTATTLPLQRPITVYPILAASVSAAEIGPRYQDSDHNLHTVIGVKPVLSPANYPQDITIWLAYGDGNDVWQGWRTMTEDGQEFKFGEGVISGPTSDSVVLGDRQAGTIFVPLDSTYGHWVVKMASGKINNGVTPETVGSVAANFDVTPIGACRHDGITDAVFLPSPLPTRLKDFSPDRTIVYSWYHDGGWCWAYYGIEYTTPNIAFDINYWTTELTRQKGYTQPGNGTITGNTTLTSDPDTFLPEEVGFEIHVRGILTTIASVISDTTVTLANAQENGAAAFELWVPAPDDEGRDEDPFLHYRGARFFSNPQIEDVISASEQIITSKGTLPATWRIPPELLEDDETPNPFREYRIRMYNVSRAGTDRSGSAGNATHTLQDVAWKGKDHGKLFPVAPGARQSTRNFNAKSLAGALRGGDGEQLRVVAKAPLFVDIETDSLAIGLSGDYVVEEQPPGSGNFVLSQYAVDLAKAINFGANKDGTPMFDTKGKTTFLINALAVNYLIAGDALFAGDTTFAREGGGKVTINSSGLKLQDNLTNPTHTVTITSAGFQARHVQSTPIPVDNSVIVNANGIQATSNIGSGASNVTNTMTLASDSFQLFSTKQNASTQSLTMYPTGITLQSVIGPAGNTYINTLQMDSSSLKLISKTQSIEMDATKIKLTMSGPNAPVLLLQASGLTATSGNYVVTVDPNQIKLDSGTGGAVCTVTAASVVFTKGTASATLDANGFTATKDANTRSRLTSSQFVLDNPVDLRYGSVYIQLPYTEAGGTKHGPGIALNGGTPPNGVGGTASLQITDDDGAQLMLGSSAQPSAIQMTAHFNVTTLMMAGNSTITCTTLNCSTLNVSSLSVSGTMNATGGFTGGSFRGAGVDVGSNGIGCGYLTTHGGSVDCGTVNCGGTVTTNTLAVTTFSPTTLNVVGTPTDGLRINNVLRCRQDGIWLGGVQCIDHVYGIDFGINYGSGDSRNRVGSTGSFVDRDGKTITVLGGLVVGIV